MASEYRDNHYVPQWYQRRFIPAEKKEKPLFYLDLQPGSYVGRDGVIRTHRAVQSRSPKKCFFETDLYTTRFGESDSVEIEKFFFGRIDNRSGKAAAYFADFTHPSIDRDSLRALVRHMSAQKLRTPKGLAWLRSVSQVTSKNQLLRIMRDFVDLFAAIWFESIWQIADASNSGTKFIISDHPVTVYNRNFPPESLTAGEDDPDIRWHGTHTIFPLSMNKVLIMTNLSWVRNPYQAADAMRPNPRLMRDALFDFQRIQTSRRLSEIEVREINHIIKRRAFRYVAAAEEDWLYPEQQLQTTRWNELGAGLLLMPDPRSTEFTGKIIIGHGNGRRTSLDEYGLQPSQSGFADEERSDEEWKSFHRFRGEFARRFGPERRGRSFRMTRFDPERDSEEQHELNLRYETGYERFTRA
jgi:Protein of unknown function (DUF4238)